MKEETTIEEVCPTCGKAGYVVTAAPDLLDVVGNRNAQRRKNGEAFNPAYVGTQNDEELYAVVNRVGYGGPAGATTGQRFACGQIRNDEDALLLLRLLKTKTASNASIGEALDKVADALKREDGKTFAADVGAAFSLIDSSFADYDGYDDDEKWAMNSKSIMLTELDAVEFYAQHLRYKDDLAVLKSS
jgi:hypothetical protein